MTLIFKMELEIMAEKWEDEQQKIDFMKNAEDVVNQGLMRMTVPDWKATVIDVEEKKK